MAPSGFQRDGSPLRRASRIYAEAQRDERIGKK
jgi:hypothetical protein